MSSDSNIRLQPFPATRWSLIERARQSDEQGRHEALSVLLQRYVPALRAHLVAEKRLSADRADDVLQGFIADKIIEQNLLEHAQQAKGKFRSFLLVTLNNYSSSQSRNERAAKRKPTDGLCELGADAQDMAGGEDPAVSFHLAWARELIMEALRRMESECSTSGRADLWRIFEGRVIRTTLEGREPCDYAQLVKELNLAAPLDACRLLTKAKRIYARHLRAVAVEYTDGKSEAEAEIEDLRNILAKAGAQSPRLSRS